MRDGGMTMYYLIHITHADDSRTVIEKSCVNREAALLWATATWPDAQLCIVLPQLGSMIADDLDELIWSVNLPRVSHEWQLQQNTPEVLHPSAPLTPSETDHAN